MNTQLLQPYLTRVLIVVIGLLSIGIAPEAKADLRPGASLADVYVDESALVAGGSLVSVIISGPNTDSLYEAVSAVGGVVTSELWLIDAVAATVSRAHLDRLARTDGVSSVVYNGQLEGAALRDVQPTDDPMVYEYLSPVTVDVGANLVHNQAIKGDGIGVAVVDSGVYFDQEVRKLLDGKRKQQFMGQADFVGDGRCGPGGGRQQSDHCFAGWQEERDLYGHGSHVSGIIWSDFTDADTGTSSGIAPEASLLSVRVLDDDGLGTYEDVIQGIQYVVANRAEFKNPIRVLNLSLSAAVTVPYFVDPLNRAVEQAWAAGLVVVAAAGNDGPGAETITVPGNDPYVITVGAVDAQPYTDQWGDDDLPTWSSTGPTRDGFLKPDVLAPGVNIISFMYNDPKNPDNSACLPNSIPTTPTPPASSA